MIHPNRDEWEWCLSFRGGQFGRGTEKGARMRAIIEPLTTQSLAWDYGYDSVSQSIEEDDIYGAPTQV